MLAVLGPTASGKTDLSIEVARSLGGEIISVDSMQVYKEMDIGTAKPSLAERRGVVHHMIDVVDPEDEFSVAEFRQMGRTIMDSAVGPLIICGGSGLHYRALIDQMSFAPTQPELRSELEDEELELLVGSLLAADPDAGVVVDLQNKRRVVRAVEILRLTGDTPTARATSTEADDIFRYVPEVEFTAVGLDAGEELDLRIDQRLARMRVNGLVDEVERLQDRLGRTARAAVGYREILMYLGGELSEEDAFAAIGHNTRRLAKKQRTWFQRDPRIQWIPWDTPQASVERAMEILT